MGPSVLIVEDEIAVRRTLERQLSSNGYSTRGVASGVEALLETAVRKPDVILLDIDLPGIDGWETLQRLKSDLATAVIPVVMLTVQSTPDDIIHGYSSGAVYFISKPYDLDELLRGIELALSEKRSL